MPQCAGCLSSIEDRFLMSIRGRNFHERCLRCESCERRLSDRCFVREGKLLCITDYFRAFGPKCPICDEGLDPQELVRCARGRPYHLRCFVCNFCQQPLNTGDEFYLPETSCFPICKADVERLKKHGVERRKHPAKEEKSEVPRLCETGSPEVSGTEEKGEVGGVKRRGPRTTINAKQLECLKAAFVASPKPTRVVRERLAQETGLTMRVIQVWFQNRRSKERRMKQLNALGTRRSFFRGGRRLRAMRLLPDEPDLQPFPFRNMAEYLALPTDHLQDFDLFTRQLSASAGRLSLYNTLVESRPPSESSPSW